MGLENILKKSAGIFLAGSLALSGCFMPQEAKTYKLERNFVVPDDYGKNPESITEANSILFDFPDADKIPGARQVDKYLTPRAKYCLIHIRQTHFKKGMTEDKKQEIIEVQEDIYKILSYLKENFGLREVYVEGITPEMEEIERKIAETERITENMRRIFVSDLEKQINNLERRLNDEPLISILYPEKEDAKVYRDSLKKEIQEKQDALAEENKKYQEVLELRKKQILYGAASVLSDERKLKILVAEDKKIQERAEYRSKKLERNKMLTFGEILDITENREDFVLESVFKQEKSKDKHLAVIVLGGIHAFGGKYSFGKHYTSKGRVNLIDNIGKWNFFHPDDKFSLIEIIPEGYRRNENRKN